MRFAEANTAFFPRVKKKKTKRSVKNFQRIIILLLLLLLLLFAPLVSFLRWFNASRFSRLSMSYACVINLSKGRRPPPFRREQKLESVFRRRVSTVFPERYFQNRASTSTSSTGAECEELAIYPSNSRISRARAALYFRRGKLAKRHRGNKRRDQT